MFWRPRADQWKGALWTSSCPRRYCMCGSGKRTDQKMLTFSSLQTVDPTLLGTYTLALWLVRAPHRPSSLRGSGSEELWPRKLHGEHQEAGGQEGWIEAGEMILWIHFQRLSLEPASQPLPKPPFSYCLHALPCGCDSHTRPLVFQSYICSSSLICDAASHTFGAVSLQSERQMTRELFVFHMPLRL